MGVEDFLRNGSLGIFVENLRNFRGFFVGILCGFCADFDASFWRGGRGAGGLELGFEAELRLR